MVAATVRPLPGRHAPPPAAKPTARAIKPSQSSPLTGQNIAAAKPQMIEPARLRRMARGLLGDRIDLHGLNQDQARAELIDFLVDCARRGVRGALIITGKGTLGDGVLRRRVPDWLTEAPLRPLVAGISEAHRRHGGAGALYVALKRREAT